MLELAPTATDSDELARVTSDTDSLEALCSHLGHAAETWDKKGEELSRRRAAIAAGDEAERARFLDSLSDFARRLVTGSSPGKRPTAPNNDPLVGRVIDHTFEAAEEKAVRLAGEARALRSHGEALAGALDLTGATVALSELLEANAPLVTRFLELREAAGLVAMHVNPVVLDKTLDTWRPVFEALLGSRTGYDVDGRVRALGWLHRAGVSLPDHLAEIDTGKRRIEIADGRVGGERLTDQVAAFKDAAERFLEDRP